MEEPDFGVHPNNPSIEKPVSHKPKPTYLMERQKTPWLAIFLIVLVVSGGLFYLAYNGHFKSEVTQIVEPEINVSTPVNVENNYEIKNEHTIVNNFSLKIWIEGDEVEIDLE